MITFVKTRHEYDPYHDFFRLAELSGYPICYYDEIEADNPAHTYIITPLNGEWQHGWKNPKAQIILWDLEWRLKIVDFWAQSDLTIPPGVTRVWASDKWYAEKIGADYVPLGSHAGLVGATTPSMFYDATLLAYMVGFRQQVEHELLEYGVSIGKSAWGDERDSLLKGCSAMLHVHQHEGVKTIAPLRFAIAAAYKLPVISESVFEQDIYASAALFAERHCYIDYAATLLQRHKPLLKLRGEHLHDILCIQYPFKHWVEGNV